MAINDQFPNGLRILVVDDDTSCLFILEKMLLRLMYQVTICSQADVALTILRERKGCFDLVLSDVHMPGMNGYKLLQQVGLEMDLPVIMMSADGRTTTVMTGINHGACDYLIKPIRPEELKNIWQHVVRRKCVMNKEFRSSLAIEDNNKKNSGSVETVFSASECSEGSLMKRRTKKKKRSVDREDNENDDLLDPGNSKKSRVVWSIELHEQFVNAVNQLGIDKAVPKRILELMNVPGLNRENVASHLQKFRLYLKRLSGAASQSKDTECIKRYENIQALVSSGQVHPQTLAALFGQPIDNHLSASFGVWIPNDDLGRSQTQNFAVDVSSASNRSVSVTNPMAVHDLSSSANFSQKDDVNNNTDHRIRQGYGSNVNEESWILERSSRQRY
ncbi:PREDICTED: two-component response regulator ARR14-like isoform X2 [Camelina sativa]|uniref:Two-component response regulator n=1 Tax=Camelina sativa TaxID=90675 RepID=A0ABM0YJY7_CAMSA|nr:PREDICTED: two-component response regulator ARR14-like isoform X2 [Camelina sativa]